MTAGVQTHLGMLSVSGASMDSLKQTMRSWSSRQRLVFTLHGQNISAHAQDLLQRLVLSRAFPDSGQPYRICSADEDAIHELASLQVVQPLSRCSEFSEWAMTPFGAASPTDASPQPSGLGSDAMRFCCQSKVTFAAFDLSQPETRVVHKRPPPQQQAHHSLHGRFVSSRPHVGWRLR